MRNTNGPAGTLAALRASSGLPQRHDGMGPGAALDNLVAAHDARLDAHDARLGAIEDQLTGGESTESGTEDES